MSGPFGRGANWSDERGEPDSYGFAPFCCQGPLMRIGVWCAEREGGGAKYIVLVAGTGQSPAQLFFRKAVTPLGSACHGVEKVAGTWLAPGTISRSRNGKRSKADSNCHTKLTPTTAFEMIPQNETELHAQLEQDLDRFRVKYGTERASVYRLAAAPPTAAARL